MTNQTKEHIDKLERTAKHYEQIMELIGDIAATSVCDRSYTLSDALAEIDGLLKKQLQEGKNA